MLDSPCFQGMAVTLNAFKWGQESLPLCWPEDFKPGDSHPDDSTCDEGEGDSPASVETLSEISTAT